METGVCFCVCSLPFSYMMNVIISANRKVSQLFRRLLYLLESKLLLQQLMGSRFGSFRTYSLA